MTNILQSIYPKIILSIILGVFIGITGSSYFEKNYLPRWAADLPLEAYEAKKKFDVTVKEKFATGTDARLMIDELESAGFQKSWYNENSAVHIKKDITCTYKRIVTWNTDKNMIITSINGDYEAICL